MFENVLIGVDGRDGGRDAIALARLLGSATARFALANIYGEGWLLGRGAAATHPIERDQSRKCLAAERSAARIDAELISLAQTPVGRGLHLLAEHRCADLLVVGSSRHGVLGRVLMGDDARASLNGAPSAVAVAPLGYAHAANRIATIGVGYDDSDESKLALRAAREQAARHGATIRALSVVSLENVRADSPIPADWPATVARLVEQRLRRLQELQSVGATAVQGGPREELARLSHEVDLLVVGSRGYGPAGRLFHGSVSNHLVRHAACPLLALPRAVAEHRPDQDTAHEQAVAVS